MLTNLTWSKAIDNGSAANEGKAGPPNPFDFRSARGPADFDQTIRYKLSANYLIPRLNVQGWQNSILNDWQVNAIVALYAGLPFTVLSGTDRSLSGVGNDLADRVGNPRRPANVNKVAEYFNTAAFVQAAIGTFGNVGRNSLRGPSYADVDLSVFKDLFRLERVQAQFQAEAFNAFNHTNFNNPISTVSSGTYGQLTSAQSPHVFQLALKLAF